MIAKYFFATLLTMLPFFAFAQSDALAEWEAQKQAYRTGTDSERKALDEQNHTFELMSQKQWVKDACGVPFGATQKEVYDLLNGKFGNVSTLQNGDYVVQGVNYAKQHFDYIVFSFQSDGKRTYFNSCMFIITSNSKEDAMNYYKSFRYTLGEKYTMVDTTKEVDGFPFSAGGYSPLWDGHWYSLDNPYFMAVQIDVMSPGYGEYTFRLKYGPYPYVKEEF